MIAMIFTEPAQAERVLPVTIAQKSGSFSLGSEYGKLNALTVREPYPLIGIEKREAFLEEAQVLLT